MNTNNKHVYGETMHGLTSAGQPLVAGVFNEHQVTTAAGLTLVMGGIALAYASLAHVYLPIQIITLALFVEFFIRISFGIQFSPIGLVAGLLAKRKKPDWVSAKPKRFAWFLQMCMSLMLAIITNMGIHGIVPLTIGFTYLALMWMEAVLGICLGCEIHALMVRYGWAAKDPSYEICSNGACEVLRQ